MSRASVSIALASSLCMGALVAGCASPGDPTPRHSVVPAPITDLAARQYGSEIVLTFSIPMRSTDHEPLAERPSIEIFRADLAPGVAADKKSAWRVAYTIPSERVDAYVRNDRISFHDPISPADLGHPDGNHFAYMVRTRASKARASDDSNIITVLILPPPAPASAVAAKVTESSIILNWSEVTLPSGTTSAGYRVYREQAETGQDNISQNPSQAKLKSPQELIGTAITPDFRDSHFEFDETYSYTVRSVAAYGTDLVESADSAAVIVTPRDIFPPAAPTALEVAIIPANPNGIANVELSWEINSEPDLAGYRVYRSDQEETSGERLNAELLPSPSFRDISVVSGKRYFYRVSAVDRAGNESPLSSIVPAEVP
jgi:hypothetical protein